MSVFISTPLIGFQKEHLCQIFPPLWWYRSHRGSTDLSHSAMSIFQSFGNHPGKLVACSDSSASKITVILALLGGPGAVLDDLRCIKFSIIEEINTNIAVIAL